MDSKTATAALSLAESAHYSGVVSAHCCSSPQLFKRIYAVGGFVNPPALPALGMVGAWRMDRRLSSPRYAFGFGWGSDENGLAEQPGPQGIRIRYPFRSYDGRVTFTNEQWGDRRFNLNTDGVANYGLYADWLHQLQLTGGAPVMRAMFNGAEAYLEMWERAYGVPTTHCQAPDAPGTSLRIGDTPERALYRAGQPVSRPGRSFRYCVSGGGRAALVFNPAGHAVLALTTSPRAHRPMAAGHMLYRGVWRAKRYVYGDGFVAIVAPSELRSPARVRADLRAAGI
jgi:hypothetical protein